MPYYNVNPQTLYQSCLSANYALQSTNDKQTRALAWVEAENVFEVWKIVQRWFEMMDNGDYFDRYPDPNWRDEDHPQFTALTMEVADKFVYEMDEDFLVEKNRFQGKLAPDFGRLPEHSRLAFVQECYLTMKSSVQIREEAMERLKAGEVMPPPMNP